MDSDEGYATALRHRQERLRAGWLAAGRKTQIEGLPLHGLTVRFT